MGAAVRRIIGLSSMGLTDPQLDDGVVACSVLSGPPYAWGLTILLDPVVGLGSAHAPCHCTCQRKGMCPYVNSK
jgi:hypothetical protein